MWVGEGDLAKATTVKRRKKRAKPASSKHNPGNICAITGPDGRKVSFRTPEGRVTDGEVTDGSSAPLSLANQRRVRLVLEQRKALRDDVSAILKSPALEEAIRQQETLPASMNAIFKSPAVELFAKRQAEIRYSLSWLSKSPAMELFAKRQAEIRDSLSWLGKSPAMELFAKRQAEIRDSFSWLDKSPAMELFARRQAEIRDSLSWLGKSPAMELFAKQQAEIRDSLSWLGKSPAMELFAKQQAELNECLGEALQSPALRSLERQSISTLAEALVGGRPSSIPATRWPVVPPSICPGPTKPEKGSPFGEITNLVFTGEISSAKGRARMKQLILEYGQEMAFAALRGMTEIANAALSSRIVDTSQLQVYHRTDNITVVRLSSVIYRPSLSTQMTFSDLVVPAVREVCDRLAEHPDRLRNMPEEHLRDEVLSMLNMGFRLHATAEAKRGKGKTDIHVPNPLDPTEVMVIECKIWAGPTEYCRAIDQLLGYELSADKMAILLAFSKNARFGDISPKAQEAVSLRSDFVPDSISEVVPDSDIGCYDFKSALIRSGNHRIEIKHLFFDLGRDG